MSLTLSHFLSFQSRNFVLRFWSSFIKTFLRKSGTSRVNRRLFNFNDFRGRYSLLNFINRLYHCLRTWRRNMLFVGTWVLSLLISFRNICGKIHFLLLILWVFIGQIRIFKTLLLHLIKVYFELSIWRRGHYSIGFSHNLICVSKLVFSLFYFLFEIKNIFSALLLLFYCFYSQWFCLFVYSFFEVFDINIYLPQSIFLSLNFYFNWSFRF